MKPSLLVVANNPEEFAELIGEVGVPLSFLENAPKAQLPELFPFDVTPASIITEQSVTRVECAQRILTALRNGDIGEGATAGFPDMLIVALMSEAVCSLFVPGHKHNDYVLQSKINKSQVERSMFLEKYLPKSTLMSVNGIFREIESINENAVRTKTGTITMGTLRDIGTTVRLFKHEEFKTKSQLLDEVAREIANDIWASSEKKKTASCSGGPVNTTGSEFSTGSPGPLNLLDNMGKTMNDKM